MGTDSFELKNAIIDEAELRCDDHGVLTGYIGLDYGGTHQSFGGHALYLPKSFTYHKIETLAGHWIFRVMEIAGVTKWENLVGKTIRVKASWGEVREIGHIVKDDWFNPSKDFEPITKQHGDKITA
jgi:hypothetical protein